jgi:hypothetical protein
VDREDITRDEKAMAPHCGKKTQTKKQQRGVKKGQTKSLKPKKKRQK